MNTETGHVCKKAALGLHRDCIEYMLLAGLEGRDPGQHGTPPKRVAVEWEPETQEYRVCALHGMEEA